MSQPELVCARCAEVEKEIAKLKNACGLMGEENNELAEEIRNGHQTRKTLERQIAKMRADITKDENGATGDKDVKAVFEYWSLGIKSKRHRLTKDRVKLIKEALKTYTVQELQQAIDGALLKPYMGFGKRAAFLTKQCPDLALDLGQMIGKARYVEDNVQAFNGAQTAAQHRLELIADMWERHSGIEQAYYQLVMNALAAREMEREGRSTSNVVELIDSRRNELEQAA